jgi:enoyl-CoA hydratase/carnithine racemase
MGEDMVIYEKRESTAIITLNRPHTNNAINAQMVAQVKDIGGEISGDNDIRVLIIAGRETFCAGTDSKELSLSERKADVLQQLSVSSIVAGLEVPTIAAINGEAFGQGLELALACDLRICTESALFAMNHMASGDTPWDGGTQRLPRLVGRGNSFSCTKETGGSDVRPARSVLYPVCSPFCPFPKPPSPSCRF